MANVINFNEVVVNGKLALKGEKKLVMAALSAITSFGGFQTELVGGPTEPDLQARMYYAFIPYYRRYSCGHLELIERRRELVAVYSALYNKWTFPIAHKTWETSIFKNGQYAEIIDGHFAIVKDIDDVCSDCARKEIDALREKYLPGQSIQAMTFSHGVCAYRYTDAAGVEARIRGLEEIKGEICAGLVDDDLGEIGVYLNGNIDLASQVDLCSSIEADGMRRFNMGHYEKFLVTEAADLYNDRSHVEVWMRNPRIQSVWVKAGAVGKYAAVIENLENDGYTVKVVA